MSEIAAGHSSPPQTPTQTTHQLPTSPGRFPRYAVFSGGYGEEGGGWQNYDCSFPTVDEAVIYVCSLGEAGEIEDADEGDDTGFWWQIVDLISRTMVFNSYDDEVVFH